MCEGSNQDGKGSDREESNDGSLEVLPQKRIKSKLGNKLKRHIALEDDESDQRVQTKGESEKQLLRHQRMSSLREEVKRGPQRTITLKGATFGRILLYQVLLSRVSAAAALSLPPSLFPN